MGLQLCCGPILLDGVRIAMIGKLCRFLVVATLLSACVGRWHVSDILAGILPDEAEFEVEDLCESQIIPTTAIFKFPTLVPDREFLDAESGGIWSRFASLKEFGRTDELEFASDRGVFWTAFDSKSCLEAWGSPYAEIWSSDDVSGLFYRSDDRQVVAVILDEPSGVGVLMLQMP